MRPHELPDADPTKRINEEILADTVPFVAKNLVRGVTWATFVKNPGVYFATYKQSLLTITDQFSTLLSLGVGENERHSGNIYIVPAGPNFFEGDFNTIAIMQRDFERAVDILSNDAVPHGGKPLFGLQNEDGTPLALYPGRLKDPSTPAAHWYDSLYAHQVKTLGHELAIAKSSMTGGALYADLYMQIHTAGTLLEMSLALGAIDGSGYGV